MRILIRTSRLASWARRFSSFALPLAVIPIFLHRAQIIDSDTFALIGTIAIAMAAAGFIIGLGAYARLWHTGDRGWSRATTGVIFGAICLLPLGYALFEMQRYPATADVTTNPGNDLRLIEVAVRPLGGGLSQDEVLTAFPNVITREYQINVNDTYRLVETLIKAREWGVISRQPPQLEDEQGQINALEMTLFGWHDEIAVRVTGDFANAQVAMRSASLAASHDLGRNGRRIEAFLLDMDAAVIDELRNRPGFNAPPVPVTQSGGQ